MASTSAATVRNPERQQENMRHYYRFHAMVYDATRWAFLFGREQALRLMPLERNQPQHLLEVGCGTGHNLKQLARLFPHAFLTGVDVSPDMLREARQATRHFSDRLTWYEKPYEPGSFELDQPAGGILISYALTMFNPGWEAAIERAYNDLAPGGFIVVVDFHTSRFAWFKWWMGKNHVRMDGHLLPFLKNRFHKVHKSVRSGWGGLWQYFIFVGQKPA